MRDCWLYVPVAAADELEPYIPKEYTARDIERDYNGEVLCCTFHELDTSEDAEERFEHLIHSNVDFPFDLSQDPTEGGYAFSCGEILYHRPGQQDEREYGNEELGNFVNMLNELKEISSSIDKHSSLKKALRDLIKKYEGPDVTPIDEAAAQYNASHKKESLLNETSGRPVPPKDTSAKKNKKRIKKDRSFGR